MDDKTHTPGPWSVGPYFDNDGALELIIERKTQHGNMVVAVALPGLFGQEANARLIAASPRLLQFAIAMRDSHATDSFQHKEACAVIAAAIGSAKP